NIRQGHLQDNASPSALTRGADVSIIIVSWNVRFHLVNCLRALYSGPVSDGLLLEVIVVDNASTDGSPEAVVDYPIIVIRNDTNLGYGRANNRGLRAASGRHLLILNPDTIPQPGALRHLIDFADDHPNAGIVAPRLLNPDHTIQTAAFRFPTLPMALLDLFPPPAWLPGRIRSRLLHSALNGRYPQEQQKSAFRIDHPLGACLLLKRTAFEQCGGFNESIFMYSEEIDLALRYSHDGWECWQEPAARVIHLGGQSTAQIPDRMFGELWRSRLYIFDTYYTPLAAFSMRALLVAAMLKNILSSMFARLFRRASKQETSRYIRKWSATLRMAVSR
ncbi:MAG: glycosyltransferase family 2 protein, partial [Chloroflexota bacterium]